LLESQLVTQIEKPMVHSLYNAHIYVYKMKEPTDVHTVKQFYIFSKYFLHRMQAPLEAFLFTLFIQSDFPCFRDSPRVVCLCIRS